MSCLSLLTVKFNSFRVWKTFLFFKLPEKNPDLESFHYPEKKSIRKVSSHQAKTCRMGTVIIWEKISYKKKKIYILLNRVKFIISITNDYVYTFYFSVNHKTLFNNKLQLCCGPDWKLDGLWNLLNKVLTMENLTDY